MLVVGQCTVMLAFTLIAPHRVPTEHVDPMSLCLDDGVPTVKGRLKLSSHSLRASGTHGDLSRAFRDCLNASRRTRPHTEKPLPFVVQQVAIKGNQGFRLDGHHPSELQLLPASNGNCEHIVFATITGDPNTRLAIFTSDPQHCRVVCSASNGNQGLPSGMLLAIGFNRHHLNTEAVAIKIRTPGKTDVEVRLVTASGMITHTMPEDQFDDRIIAGMLTAPLIKQVQSRGTRLVEWPMEA